MVCRFGLCLLQLTCLVSFSRLTIGFLGDGLHRHIVSVTHLDHLAVFTQGKAFRWALGRIAIGRLTISWLAIGRLAVCRGGSIGHGYLSRLRLLENRHYGLFGISFGTLTADLGYGFYLAMSLFRSSLLGIQCIT